MQQNSQSLIDTNYLVRFLTNDDPDQANQVEKLLHSSNRESIELTDVVVVELVFVLKTLYKLTSDEIIDKLGRLFACPAFLLDKELWTIALREFGRGQVSVVDAYICAKAKLGGQTLLTFDKKLERNC